VAEDLAPLPHPARADGGGGEIVDVLAVDVDQARGQEDIEGLPHYFFCPVAKDPFGALIEQNDPLLGIHGYDRVIREVEDPGEGMIR